MSADYEDTNPESDYSYHYESFILKCVSEYEDEENELRNLGEKFCPAVFKCFMCWPPTPAGQTSTTTCPPEIDDQFNLSGGTATNYCGPDGNWTVTDDQCVHILTSGEVCRCHHCDALTYIMMAGYSVSLIALVIAFFMIVGIRALRVKRNKIHANLLASFICLYTLSLFSIIFYFYVEPRPPVCQITLMLLSYFTLCNFAWMSLEGFYLYALVVLAFRIEPDKIRMWKYCLVGWGPPAILILCQCIAFIVQGSPDVEIQVPHDYNDMNTTYEHGLYNSYSYNYGNASDNDDDPINCWRPEGVPWQQYAFMIVPMLFLLAVNVFFLAMILKVLLPKIKTTGKNNMRNHLKMLKSAVVLVVLLGTVYIVFLIEPQIKNVTPLAKYIMTVINTTLQVTQGLAVAILYVFMNSDVQTKVSTEARRFSDRRLSSIKGLSIRPSNGNGGNSSVRTKVNRRLERLRLGNEARNRGSYAGDKTQTFSLSDSSSTDRQLNGRSQNGSTDHNSNGNIPQTLGLIEGNERLADEDDEVFQETSLIQKEENSNENSNGYVKLREESVCEYGEKPSEEAECLIDVRL